jgi:hypothetical protein
MSHKITITPYETINITGYIDTKIDYKPTVAIMQEASDTALPDFIDVEPSIINYNYLYSREVTESLSNLTTNTVTIPPKSTLCELQPVTIAMMLLKKLKKKK